MTRPSPTVDTSREDRQFLDSVSFVDAMEHAQERGDSEVVELNLPTLDRLLEDLATRKKELESLRCRARAVRKQHNSDAAGDGTYVSQG